MGFGDAEINNLLAQGRRWLPSILPGSLKLDVRCSPLLPAVCERSTKRPIDMKVAVRVHGGHLRTVWRYTTLVVVARADAGLAYVHLVPLTSRAGCFLLDVLQSGRRRHRGASVLRWGCAYDGYRCGRRSSYE